MVQVNRSFLTCLILLAFLSSLPAALPELFPVDQLRPGLRGQTLTVMQGIEIVSLETEVLGVLKNGLGPGKDLIIGKLVDEKSNLTGAVHGMSGSPLYIDGKLVGALSRRLMQFEKDGHCGFTPIRDMLDVQSRGRGRNDPDKGPSPFWGFGSVPGRDVASSLMDSRLVIKPDTGQWLAVPFSMTGWSESMLSALRPIFSQMAGFLPVAAGSGEHSGTSKKIEIRPGSALSVLLIDGDIRAGGTGTATTVDGNQVTAFGHPMMGIGPTELPLAGAEIITTMPSYSVPHKIANIGPAAGTIWQDRLSAISGEVGRLPEMARYEIRRQHEKQARPCMKGTFVKEEWLAPQLLMMLMAQSVMEEQDFSREATVRMAGEIRFKGLPSLTIKGLYSGGQEQRVSALMDQMIPLSNLYQSFPRQIEVESLTLSVETYERSSEWVVETLNVRTKKLKKGEKIESLVRLKDGSGRKRLEEVSLEVPEELKGTAFQLRVSSGRQLQSAEKNLLKTGGIARAADYLNAMNTFFEQDVLYFQIITQEQGVLSRNHTQLGLPYSVGQVMRDSDHEAVQTLSTAKVWQQQEIRLPGVVTGSLELGMEME
jgi:hypothetical protein